MPYTNSVCSIYRPTNQKINTVFSKIHLVRFCCHLLNRDPHKCFKYEQFELTGNPLRNPRKVNERWNNINEFFQETWTAFYSCFHVNDIDFQKVYQEKKAFVICNWQWVYLTQLLHLQCQSHELPYYIYHELQIEISFFFGTKIGSVVKFSNFQPNTIDW